MNVQGKHLPLIGPFDLEPCLDVWQIDGLLAITISDNDGHCAAGMTIDRDAAAKLAQAVQDYLGRK